MTASDKITRKNPTLEAFRALMALEKHHGVSAAAMELGQSQPVVSRKLQIFEEQDNPCGAILLTRSRGSLQLTDVGHAAMPAIRELIRSYDQLLGFLRGTKSSGQLVRVGIGSFAAQHYLPRAIASTRKKDADFEIEMRIARGEDRIKGVVDGQFEMGIVSHSHALIEDIANKHAGEDTTLTIVPLAHQHMCVIAHKDTEEGTELGQLGFNETVRVQQLSQWDLVGLDRRSGIRQQIEQQITNPDELHFLAEGGGWMAAKECVRHQVGVAIVPLAALSPDDDDTFVIRSIATRFAVKYSLIYRAHPLNSAQDTVKQELLEAARHHQDVVHQRWKR